MKKLYRKSTIHPSPPVTTDQYLSLLPATILTLAAALPPEEVEVLAYLISISCSSTNYLNFSDHRKKSPNNIIHGGGSGGGGRGSEFDHPPLFSCDCFRCYKSYWVRWDSSPNRQIIHEILDAYEDGLAQGNKTKGKKVRKRRNGGKGEDSGELKRPEQDELGTVEAGSSGGGGCDGGEGGGEKGSARKFVSFIGEKIWGVWG